MTLNGGFRDGNPPLTAMAAAQAMTGDNAPTRRRCESKIPV